MTGGAITCSLDFRSHMQSRISWKWSLKASLFTALLAGLGADLAFGQETLPAGILTNAPQVTATNPPARALDITEAPARPISAQRLMPPNVRTSGPFTEIVKIVNSGVDEKVMLALVTNSTSIVNLSADEIVYLNDIGAPSAVVTAIIEQDHKLKSAAPAPAAPPVPEMVSPNVVALPPPQPAPPLPGYPPMQPYAPPDFAAEPDYAPFYDALSPYGSWVDVEGYGPCWQPNAVVIDPSWQPYFDGGFWSYTDCGWYWWSDYSWGWAPYHYGSWFHHNRLGWCWAPGTVWGPSWVTWRYNDGFCGWAPMPPGTAFSVEAGLTFHGRRIQDHDDLGIPQAHYRFVAWDHFLDRHLVGRSLPSEQAARVFGKTAPVTRISGTGRWINNDPLPTAKVASATHAPVRSVAVREMSATAGGSRSQRFEANGRFMMVYRPRISEPGSVRWTGSVPASRPSSSAPMGRPAARNGGSPRGSVAAGSAPPPWIRPQRAESLAPPASTPAGGAVAEGAGYAPPPQPSMSLPSLPTPAFAPPSAFAPLSQLVVPQNPYANPGPATAPLAPPVQLPGMMNMGGIYSAPAGWGPSVLIVPGVIRGR